MIRMCRFFLILFLAMSFGSLKSLADFPKDRNPDNQTSTAIAGEQAEDIMPYSENPWYWQYQGKPILLHGGSDDDNLWQWTGKKLTDQLDLLKSVGGNYVRNTMSDRDADNIFAHIKNQQGKFDLNVWNNEYWKRLDDFLFETSKRGIIVQLTLWDHFDLGSSRFPIHPLNPKNNLNWEVGVITHEDDYYGGSLKTGNQKVIAYQHKYVDKLLSVVFKYNHILFNISNESSLGAEWEDYWANYLKNKASGQGKIIYLTSMQMVSSNGVRHVIGNRDLFSFVEVSQNSQDSKGGRGKAHYDNIIHFRRMIEADSRGPLPMNNEKIYGSGDGRNYSSGTGREAEDRFWKNIFAGCASVRFHRNEGFWGIGLSDRAQANIKSMTLFLEEFDIFNAVPYEGIKMHGASEGYAMANMGKEYAVYLPGGRYSVELDPWIFVKKIKVKFLDIDTSTWSDEKIIDVKWEEEQSDLFGFQRGISITSPGNKPCLALLEVVE